MLNEQNVPLQENPRASNRFKIVISGVVVLGALAAIAYLFVWPSTKGPANTNTNEPPPVPVAIANATSISMQPHSILPGTVISLTDAIIAAETSGKVLSVAMVGDVVKKGDSLAEIDPQNAEQLVAQRKAELARLKSLLSYHSDYFAWVGANENDLGIPEITVAELRSNLETAKADVASAAAALQSAQNNLTRTSIKAPFSGRVVSQSIQPGEYAQIGSDVARLVDTENLEVSAQVPAALVQPLVAGTKLQVSGMGSSIVAPLRTLVPVGDSVSRTMELRVELVDSHFMVGTPVRVTLPTAPLKEVVAIPRDAVILRPDQQYVFVVDQDVAYRKEVELGYGEGGMIEVIGEVVAGSIVVVRGGERLRDGQKVSLTTEWSRR